MASELELLEQQTSQRLWGQEYVTKEGGLIDKFGARNLKLAQEGTPADLVSLQNVLGPVKELINSGGLKTARDILTYHRPNFVVYDDLFAEAISDITDFLIGGGFE